MKAFHNRQFAANRKPKGGDPVAGRWQWHVDNVTGRSHRPCAPLSRSPLIRHSDELHCDWSKLDLTDFGPNPHVPAPCHLIRP